MPHQCTACEEVFEDGSDDILSGCSACGGASFQFIPESATQQPAMETDDEWVGGGVISNEPTPSEHTDSENDEDASQHAARTDVVDTIPDAESDETWGEEREMSSELPDNDTGSTVDTETLRKELNRQFEGIKIRDSGKYEINLAKLYEREECVISLKEDGRYVINMAGTSGRDVSLEDT